MPETPQRSDSGVLTYLGAGFVGLILGLPIGGTLLKEKNSLGVLVLAAAPVLAMIVLGTIRSKSTANSADSTAAVQERQHRRRQRVILAFCALLLGPLLAATLGALWVWLGNVHPADRWPEVQDFTILGAISGAAISLALGISAFYD